MLRYWDGVSWTNHTAPKKSPTIAQSTIGRPQQGGPGQVPADRTGAPTATTPMPQGSGWQDQPQAPQIPQQQAPQGYYQQAPANAQWMHNIRDHGRRHTARAVGQAFRRVAHRRHHPRDRLLPAHPRVRARLPDLHPAGRRRCRGPGPGGDDLAHQRHRRRGRQGRSGHVGLLGALLHRLLDDDRPDSRQDGPRHQRPSC